MKYHIPRQLLYGWTLSLLMIGASYWLETFPPKFTEFYEGDIALSYSVHDTVPYPSYFLSIPFSIQVRDPLVLCSTHHPPMHLRVGV